jgi:hypothetical protein
MANGKDPNSPSKPKRAPGEPHPDPIIEADIQRALKPYAGMAPPSLLQTMRETMEEALETDPRAIALRERIRARAVPDKSGDGPKDKGDA